MDFPVETAGEEDNVDQDTDTDKFLTSLLTSEDVFANAESSHAFVSDFALSESLRGTDTELVSTQYGNILDPTSSLYNEHGGSREFRVNNITEPSYGVGQAGTSVLSSHEVNTLHGPDTSSHLPPIFSVTSIPSPPAPRRCETKYHSRSDNLVSQKSVERSQSHGNVTSSSKEATTSGVDTSFGDLPADKDCLSICVLTRVSPPSPPASETEEDSLDLDTDVEQLLKSLIMKKEYDFPFPTKQQQPSFQYYPPAPKRCKTKYHSRSDNLESQRSATRSEPLRKLSSKAATAHEVKKETETQESKRDQKQAEGSSSRENTGTTSNGGNRKGPSMPSLGTSSGGNTSLGPSPRSRTICMCKINEMLDRLAGFSIEEKE